MDSIVACGGAHGFEGVVLPHLQLLRRTARALTRSHDDAEDLLQETVVRAWRFWHRFEPGSNVRAWLQRILRNTFINGYRKKCRERELLRAACAEADNWASAQIGTWPSAAEGVGDEVGAALSRLPDEFRSVVEMVDLADYSYREAALALGCPIGTVMSRLHRARKQLQGQLNQYAVVEGYVDRAA